jgi:alkylation response protein AidB-like acyl-CoA dehydrogenase
MDLEYTPEEAAYQARVIEFLDSIAQRRKPGEYEGYRRDQSKPGALEMAKRHQRQKFEAGFAGISWPRDWHGQGGTSIQEAIYLLEEQHYTVSTGFFDVGVRMCIPTINTFGTPEQRDRYTIPALRGEEIWCQLFSEPMAGSDLAALRTTAQKKSDQWIVNGQKIWTSGAQFCDYGLLLARTDPDVPKHKGLTMYFLRMDTPGLEIKPIKQMSGSSTFNEVFFKDCEVPDSQRVGAVGEGWKVAMGLLGRERSAPLSRKPEVGELLDYVRQMTLENGPALNDDAVREKVADFYVRSEAIRFTRLRMLTSLSRGETPGPEGSIMKLADVNRLQEMVSFAIDLLGAAGGINASAEPVKNLFEDAFFFSTALRIAGGTDEIQRNIIAERVLGLPADNRIDKNIAFRDVPTARTRP